MTLAALIAAGGSLRKGAAGDAVLQLQRALIAAGHSLLPDAHFGAITDLAVEEFQGKSGLVIDGVVGTTTAAALDAIVKSAPPLPLDKLIYVDLMYGLGDASTSAGMDVLAAALRAISSRLVVSPTVSWTQRAAIAERIAQRPLKTRQMLFGNSMGANAIPMVTNIRSLHTFELVGGFDPTIFWSCPAFGSNVSHAILYHGVNWLNPIGHARYTEAFAGQVETVNTSTTHVLIDDDPVLRQHAITAVHRRTLDAVKLRLAH